MIIIMYKIVYSGGAELRGTIKHLQTRSEGANDGAPCYVR